MPDTPRQSRRTCGELGHLDILVSNAAHHNRKKNVEDVTDEEFDCTFKTNVYAYFRLVQAAVLHLPPGASIIVTGSETGFDEPEMLPDYSATKGAIHTLTKSLAKMLAERAIRVNCVAPGPAWPSAKVAHTRGSCKSFAAESAKLKCTVNGTWHSRCVARDVTQSRPLVRSDRPQIERLRGSVACASRFVYRSMFSGMQ